MATLRRKASKLADKGLDKAEDTVDNLRSAKRRAESKYGDIADDMGGTIENFAEETGRRLRDGMDSASEYAEQGAEQAREFVSNRPLLAIAGAFVGGMVMSMLLRSNSR